MASVLITGGAGYIGSHTIIEFLNNDLDIIIIDNFSNSKPEVINRIKDISGCKLKFYQIDLLDSSKLDGVFKENHIDAVIHFAGFKAVGESVSDSLKYYKNNIAGTLELLETMKKNDVKKIVFSSSATVYGTGNNIPFKENSSLKTTSPYGTTKLMIEQILTDLCISEPDWSVIILRYFNPIGAHESGLIGEDPTGLPNNLMPFLTQVAMGRLEGIKVFGNDYDTHDGTGIRDYIHVVDLAKGHLKALQKLSNNFGLSIYNLGVGKGYSVLDVIKTFENVVKINIKYKFVERRAGDVAVSIADVNKARDELGWEAKKTLLDMCADSWKWQKLNPNGYE
ncbi:UDP-glucose 4-epimerase GalE [Paenibacillus sp. FSL R7-0345]|uniref:UDP-glucose 4-epimerase GalE n=1 Tax=Paenibacillus sp. FSL R7-0345 TaxID=2954535 RepID=UPI00315ACC42